MNPPANADRPVPGSPLVRRAIAVIALCWLSLLTWMAATTGNPIVLNAVQIRHSDAVVTAAISAGEVQQIIRVWHGIELNRKAVLPEGQSLPDGTYILPLILVRDEFVVTPLPSTGNEKIRVISLLTDDTQKQLDELLGAEQQNTQ